VDCGNRQRRLFPWHATKSVLSRYPTDLIVEVFDTNGWLDSLALAGVSIGWSARMAVSRGRSTFRTGVDEDKLKAEFKEGMLFVHLPKTEKAKSKAIEVKVE
jgi:hypothetical protein